MIKAGKKSIQRIDSVMSNYTSFHDGRSPQYTGTNPGYGPYFDTYRVYVGGKMVYPDSADLSTPYRLSFESYKKFEYRSTADGEYGSPTKYPYNVTQGFYKYTIESASPIYVATGRNYSNSVYSGYAELDFQLLVSLPYIGRGVLNQVIGDHHYMKDGTGQYYWPITKDGYVPITEKDTVFMTVQEITNKNDVTVTYAFTPSNYRASRDTTRNPGYAHSVWNADSLCGDEREDRFTAIRGIITREPSSGQAREQTFREGTSALNNAIDGTYLSHTFIPSEDSRDTTSDLKLSKYFLPIAFTGKWYKNKTSYGITYNFAMLQETYIVTENNNPSYSSYADWVSDIS